MLVIVATVRANEDDDNNDNDDDDDDNDDEDEETRDSPEPQRAELLGATQEGRARGEVAKKKGDRQKGG